MTKDTTQHEVTFAEIDKQIWEYLVARDWHKLNSRNIAISISLEANELLEHFQWSDKPVGAKDELGSELADVMIYCFEFARSQNIDIAAAIIKKLEAVKQKYPAEQFKNGQETKDQTWLRLKKGFKKDGL